mmetsp:Transcript_27572/g.44387  ORF Transcript_27572/g.44387 Transcript_27572/m.44387 type:complete len:101 (+) Transcript_27572:3-305(+)
MGNPGKAKVAGQKAAVGRTVKDAAKAKAAKGEPAKAEAVKVEPATIPVKGAAASLHSVRMDADSSSHDDGLEKQPPGPRVGISAPGQAHGCEDGQGRQGC